jgi:hypothetical protein
MALLQAVIGRIKVKKCLWYKEILIKRVKNCASLSV